jgi:hypothetical protein
VNYGMKEILTIAGQFLILSIFVALMAFYGLAFWHWRNDGRHRDAKRENSSNSVASARTSGS